MTPVTMLLLTASVVCSTARAVFSKKLGARNSSKHSFYMTQTLLFTVAAAVILVVNIKDMAYPSLATLLLAFTYGVLTVSSQWAYTAALTKAPVSVCAMVYSFGFIIPTVFGTILWHESINLLKIISILLCVGTIILTSFHHENNQKELHGLPVSLIIAMLSSGGLGLVQKIQQKSDAHNETGVFLFLAFALAMLFSLAASFLKREKSAQKIHMDVQLGLHIIIVGASMAVANTANTMLAGLLPSAVAFPDKVQ